MDTRRQNQLKAPSPSSVSPVQTGLFQPRSFTEPEREDGEALHSSHQPPDLQTQLDRAARFGHNFSRVQVQANPPAVIQPQLDIRRSEEQEDEQEADFMTEPIKMMAPPLGQPIQRESLDAEPIQMMPHPSILTSLVQRESFDAEPIQMMHQPGLLSSLVQRESFEAEPIQRMPQLGLYSPVIQREVEEVEPIQRMPQLGLYSPVIQREVEEVEPIQRMPQWGVIQRQEQEVEQEPIQTKLVVGAAGDKYEQEADSMAAQVMSMSVPSPNAGLVQRQGEEEEQEPLVQRTPLADSITPLVQRQSEELWGALQTKSLLQRAGAKSNSEAGSGLENKLSSSKGGGSPLPGEVRSFMEPRFGADFSSVRVHTDSTAVQMNKELHAQAFTHGSDIYYGSGKSPAQNSLTAHELTHVVQQTGAKKLQRSPILTQRENQELLQRLTPNKDLRRSPVEAKQGEVEEDQKTLQTKELPDRASAVTWNKAQQSQSTEEEQAKELLGYKQISNGSSNPTLEGNAAQFKSNVKGEFDKTVAKTQPQTEPWKEAAPKTELTFAAAKGVKTAAKPESAVAETESAAPEHKTKPASELKVPETGESGAAKAKAEKAPTQAVPASNMAAAPENKPGTPVPPEAVAKKAQAETTPDTKPATQATAAAPTPVPQAGAAPTLEAGGGAAEEASEREAAGPEEEEIVAAAAEAPPGSAELEPGERDAALASLAEGSGGGGQAVGGGGGGGGAAIQEKPTPPVPNVSQSEPSAAMAAVSHLPPAQLQAALGGVSAAVGNSVGKQRAELAANPPQMECPSNSKTSEGSAVDREAPSAKSPKAVEKAPEGRAKPVPQPKPLSLPPVPPVAAVPQPQVQGNAEGKLDAGDAQQLKASLRRIPTTDPGLQVSAGAPPPLELQGDADPQRAQEQRAKLEKSVAEAHAQGRQELAQPMGENEIAPKVQQEKLSAEGVGGGAGGAGGAVAKAGGGAAGEGAAGNDAVSIIAQQEKGQEIQAAVAQAQAEMGAKRQEHAAKVTEEKARSNKEITKLQQENAAQQAAERTKAQTEVKQLRSNWQKEQDAQVEKSRKDADAEVSKGAKDVQKEQTQAETKAAEHIKKGEEDAAAARRKGEEDAEREQQKGEKESSGILGWFADKAKAFFDGIKQAIQKAFELARAAVKAAIEGAKKLATAVIEAARTAIVSIIKAVGQALIAIGDVLLAAFPGLRDRFRNAIKAAVKGAEAAVNALANTLKKGVQAALNLLGKGLDAALGLMEKGMLAAVDVANKAVQGAIKFAEAAIKAIGAFAVLAKDIAASPGQWLSNLGAGAMDGIKNHFWGAFQTAVKEWFSQKVEEVLGLGMTMWNVLAKGGIKTAEVGKMAWEGIKSAIPAVLIQLLIEKVVSMIVPAAGTVLLIIEGLQAAWGTVSRILQAFERFMAFLKAVKTGQAGPPFGAALAAAGVVVIDFVSNWLLRRLRGPASKVAAKIREIAKKIGNKLKNVAKKLGNKFGKLKDKFFGKKDGKGDKGKGKEHEGEDKKKQAEKRLRKAAKEIDRALAKGEPEKEAHAIINRIAHANKVQATLIHSGKGWKLKLKVNPEIDRYFEGEELEAVKKLLHDLNKNSKDAAKVIADIRRELRIVKGLTPKEAKKQWEEDVETAGGSVAYMQQLINAGKIKDRAAGSGSVVGYTERQDVINENLAKRYADPSRRVVHVPGGRGSGHDTTLIYLDERRVEALEIKKGGLKGLDVSGRSIVPEGKTPVPFDPREGSGSEALRHLDQPSTQQGKDRRADELVSGGVLVKEREDGQKRLFENKVSSISENLKTNLEATVSKLKAEKGKLVGEIGTTSDQNVKNKLKAVLDNIEEAIEILEDIISGAGGKLALIVALEPGANASEDQIDVVDRLLEAGARRLRKEQAEQQTDISHAIKEIDNQGNVIKSR